MKKFLKKKPVMIAFIVAAIVFLAVEIGILVRPVSYGLKYTLKEGDAVTTIKIHSDSVARTSMKEGDEEAVMDMWIYRDGGKILILSTKKYVKITGMTDAQIEEMNKSCTTKDEYKERVEELKELKKNDETAYELAMASAAEYGIFKAELGDEVANCPQAIVFVAVHGAVTVALMVFAGMAIAYAVKKK